MNKTIKNITLLILIMANMLFAPYLVQGQGSEHRIEVLTNIKNNTIQVRWAPTSAIVWQLGNKYGYTLERYTIIRDGVLIQNPKSEIKTLATAPIKPISESAMETRSDTNDYVAMVKGCIYEDENGNNKNASGGFGALLMGKDEIDMRFGFALLAADLSIEAATAHGLYYEDKDVKANEKYAYRLSVAQQPKGLVIAPAVGIGALSEPNKYNPPRELGINIKGDVATLRWFIALDKRQYSAYIIERSMDGKNFVRINDKPYVTDATDKTKTYAFYKDSMPSDNINYSYRIKGITPFAEEGPYSNVVGGKITPDVALPIIDSIGVTNNHKLYLHWLLPDDLKLIAKEIFVTRAPRVTGPFTNLNSKAFKKTVESFIDEKPNQNNYYRIKVITTQNKTVYSVPNLGQVADTIAPAAPIGLQAVIDSNGIATLRWQKNTEKDLQGYRIFKSNTADQDYIENLNRIVKKTSYTDTVNINTLSKKVFYKIVAVDKNFNVSAFSTPVELKRPDKIAPVAAVFTKAVVLDSAMQIQLQWLPSSSTDDMVRQELIRKKIVLQAQKQPNGTVKNIVNVVDTKKIAIDTTGKLTEYKDSGIEQGNTYAYYVKTYDAAGNYSEAFSGELLFETGYRAGVTGIKITVNEKQNKVSLSWNKPNGDLVASYYIVYKAMDKPNFYRWKMVRTNTIEDDAIQIGSDIQYKVQAFYTNGTKTTLSNPVKVNF
jgi:uncharacterized protein